MNKFNKTNVHFLFFHQMNFNNSRPALLGSWLDVFLWEVENKIISLPLLCRKQEFYAEVYAVDVKEGTQDMLTKSSGWFLEVFAPAKKWLFSFGSGDVSKRPYLATDKNCLKSGDFAKCLDW